jgi:hypothetical protein
MKGTVPFLYNAATRTRLCWNGLTRGLFWDLCSNKRARCLRVRDIESNKKVIVESKRRSASVLGKREGGRENGGGSGELDLWVKAGKRKSSVGENQPNRIKCGST